MGKGGWRVALRSGQLQLPPAGSWAGRRDRTQTGKSDQHAPTYIPPSLLPSLNPEEKLHKEKTYSSEVGKER